ncbi:MAG: Lar family restriction alleviation protein [Clostridia bacterium]|nr:Lar family restriction alleviation protein [Clostridia bacterium]
MKTPELKPCPFCGGEATVFVVGVPKGIHPDDVTVMYEVDCENKNCEVSVCTMLYETKEKAAEVWNRRR